MADQVPPCDVEAERAVVSACLISPDALATARDLLKSDVFYDGRLRMVFESACAVDDAGLEIDPVTLASDLRNQKRYEQVGGSMALMELFDATPNPAHIEDHCRIVADKARLRRVIAISRMHMVTAYGDVGDIEEWCAAVEREVLEATDLGGRKDAPQTIGEVLAVEMPKIQERQEQKDDPERPSCIGEPTGIFELDAALAGGMDPGLYVVGARPGMGKTAFALGRALAVASDRFGPGGVMIPGKSVVFFSAEMPKDQLVFRLLSHESGVTFKSIRTGRMYPEEWEKVQAAAERLARLPISIEYRPGAHVSQVRSVCRREFTRLKRKFGTDPGFIVVDYIQLLAGKQDGNREAEVSSITRALAAYSGEFKCPIMALSQLNRNLESRPNKRPTMSDLRESGAIEQDAYVIFFLYRDDFYHEDTLEKGVAEIIVAKNRNGASGGTVLTKWVAHCARFESVNQHVHDTCDDIDASLASPWGGASKQPDLF